MMEKWERPIFPRPITPTLTTSCPLLLGGARQRPPQQRFVLAGDAVPGELALEPRQRVLAELLAQVDIRDQAVDMRIDVGRGAEVEARLAGHPGVVPVVMCDDRVA